MTERTRYGAPDLEERASRHTAWRIDWVSPVLGGGIVKNGYSLHLTIEHAREYQDAHEGCAETDRQFGRAIHEHSYGIGDPYEVDVSQETYRRIAASDNGIRK